MFLAFSHFSAETLMRADKMPIQTVIFCTKDVNTGKKIVIDILFKLF